MIQALILLWGVRLKEGLTAALDDVEGHWALCTGKTGMRIGYLNSQALGIVQALHSAGPGQQTTFAWAAPRHNRVSGWPWSVGKWHAYVKACGIDFGEKPQQDLRKRFSTWVADKDPQVEMLLAGHGGNVVFKHYLDTLRRVPAVMEQFDLPELRVELAAARLSAPAGSGADRPGSLGNWRNGRERRGRGDESGRSAQTTLRAVPPLVERGKARGRGVTHREQWLPVTRRPATPRPSQLRMSAIADIGADGRGGRTVKTGRSRPRLFAQGHCTPAPLFRRWHLRRAGVTLRA